MPEHKYVWFKTDGTQGEQISSHKLTLAEMQALVDGYIERVRVRYRDKLRDMWVNEEGLLDGLPYNHQASEIAGQPIVGDVFIML